MGSLMGRKSPKESREMMPMVLDLLGPEDMGKMMGDMKAEQIEHMMQDVMPRMMDSCFGEMDRERREFMLTHCRGMLDQMEEKYLGPAVA